MTRPRTLGQLRDSGYEPHSLRAEWPNGYGGTSPRANRETLGEVRCVTKKGITINIDAKRRTVC